YLEIFFTGGLGVAVGYPLDTIKVRIQTQKKYSGVWDCIRSTYQTEKVSGFFKGMSLPFATVSIGSSVAFGTYRNCLHLLSRLRCTNPETKPAKMDIFLSGYVAGAIQVLVMSPTDLIKVRLQTQTHSHQTPKYRGPIHCLMTIIQEEGFCGLYKGSTALIFRDGPSFATYFLSYAILCEYLTPTGQTSPDVLTVITSGGCAGMAAWTIGTPMDVIKSRLQLDGVGQRRYKGVIHCITESATQEGLTVFFKGLGLNCLRAFPVNMVVFVSYETVLKIIR
uniref:Solute carrier family 25 member 47 n=1 Tax=Latimeria chalumnae TaxID=7897 RepID=H3A1A2_LATCH